jgi:8-oxo-dGTP diphosphatase
MFFKIAIDCVMIGYDSQSNELKILFTQRAHDPKKGQWALPGGFVTKTESFEATASSILRRETGLKNVYLRQLKAYSLTDVSSSNRIASIAFYSLVKFDNLVLSKSEQPSQWFHFKDVPLLPFDHGKKVEAAIARVKELVRLEPVIFYLLPTKFPLNQLQRFYEELYRVKIDNRNFRKKIQKLPYIEKLDEVESNVSHRPAFLYQFNQKRYQDNFTLY